MVTVSKAQNLGLKVMRQVRSIPAEVLLPEGEDEAMQKREKESQSFPDPVVEVSITSLPERMAGKAKDCSP